MQKFPETPFGLLELIERLAPEQVPSHNTSRDQDLFNGGRRSIAIELRRLYENTRNPPEALPKRTRR
jgi:hypothetical protein